MNQFYFEDLSLGQCESLTKTISSEMIEVFAEISGDNNPLHLDDKYAATTRFKGRIAHGALSSSFISAVLGTLLPGMGAVYLSQSVRFLAPVRIGDKVRAEATVTSLDANKNRIKLVTSCFVENEQVIVGDAEIYVPSRKI